MSNSKMQNYAKALTVRFTQEDFDKLTYLTRLTGITKNDLILGYIRADYDKVQGNPELKNIIDKLKDLSDTIQAYQ